MCSDIDNQVDRAQRWFQMSVGDQISNIGSEVFRALRYKKSADEDKKQAFYNKAIELLNLSQQDPKNKHRIGELEFCKEELTDFFIGNNEYNTTEVMLHRYYDAFLA